MPKVSDEHRGAVRRRILDAALVCLARNDYQNVTTRELVTEADLSTGTFYNYFPTKEHLYVSLAEDLLTEDIERFQAAEPDGTSTGRGLLDFLSDYVMADPRGAVVMSSFRSQLDRSGDAHQVIERLNHFVVERFAPLVAAAQADGSVRAEVDVDAIVELLDIVWDGLGRREGSGSFQTSYQRVSETLMDVLLNGVLRE
jgi:AcrR family transcriptional regulator